MTVMPFGKYRGTSIDFVDTQYLEWALRTIKDMDYRWPWLRAAIEKEVARRRDTSGWKEPEDENDEDAKVGARKSVRDILSAVRRQMALKHHPDRGGDVAVMAAVNDALDRVAKLADS